MEYSKKSSAHVKPSERPIRTYQRSSKMALQKQILADLPEIPEASKNSAQIPGESQENSNNLSIHCVPPECLVINIEEVINSTQFDHELLNVVKDRSSDTTFKAKVKSLEAVGPKSVGSSDTSAEPTVTEGSPKLSEGVVEKPKTSEDLSPKLIKSERVLEKPKVQKKILLQPLLSESSPANPEVSVGVFVKSETPEVALGEPKISEGRSLKLNLSDEAVGKPKMLKKIVAPPLVSEKVLAKSNVSEIVKSNLCKVELEETKMSEGGPSKLNVSDGAQGTLKVLKKILVQPMVSESVPDKPKLSETVVTKSKEPKEVMEILEVSKGVLAKSTASAGLAESVLDDPRLSETVVMKSKVSQGAMGILEVLKGVIAKPTVSAGLAESVLDNPRLSERVPMKSEVSQGVTKILDVSEGVLVKPSVSTEIPANPTMSEGVLAKTKVSGSVEVKPKEPNVVKTILAKPKVLRSTLLDPKVLKVAIVKPKVPEEMEDKPKIPSFALVKPETPEGYLPTISKRGEAVLVLKAGSEPVILKPKVETKVPDTEPFPSVETNQSTTNYVPQYDPARDVDSPPLLPLLSALPLPLLPLPTVIEEPTEPVEAVKRVTEILSSQLPRRWSLRVDENAIYAMLFAPSTKCVVQRAICAPYDGSKHKFIVHAKEIPPDHVIYQYRLMRPPVELTEETAEEFANGIMGAIHSLIQPNVCVGLDEKRFVEVWQEYTDKCRFDENIFEEEGYKTTLRPLECSYLVRRRNTKRCPECSWYYSRIRRCRKKRKADMDVQIIAEKKSKKT